MSQKTLLTKPALMLALLMCAALILLLALYWAKFAYNAYLTLLFPGQIDAAEGIIWQQAMLIPGPRMYAGIQHYPFIGFQYPPVYQLIVHGIASLGAPWLVTGRLVSMLSAIALALLTAGIVKEISGTTLEQTPPTRITLIGAVVAGMIWVAFEPFQFWSYTMRVEILAVALEFLGMYLGLLSLRRPPLIYASALVFVLAVYTKQNTVAGLVATLTVLLLQTPARAVRAAALGSVLGIAAFAALTFVTDGGFVRHIILYEVVNRFSLQHAYSLLVQTHFIQYHAAYLLVSVIAVAIIGFRYFGRPLREVPPGYLLIVLYFLLTAPDIIEMGKSGANDNYLIPWVGSFALLIGVAVVIAGRIGVERGRPVYLLALSTVLVLQALNAAKFGKDRVVDPEFRREYVELIQMIKQATRPVLSDDMVLLMQAGKEIPWEPFIITELSADGLFDERKVVALIERHDLAFAVVTGSPGRGSFDERYSRAVASALARAYPVERTMAGMRVLEPNAGS